ncbi:MAG TPA: ABC transporter substrate-binding protein [Actinophytocola sp.]|uniref:ABC transporter substrate-binding protein n=1 Tax=Actinophytocola sp. TaxID=1872138 RepID=UPI002DB6F3F0|nr:ABC transporter substrate-binding protein [Actinophytocola sp.]HEU5469228.1 ABC transporter substrate-binding protein [Actinophytocola sp.]
MNERRLSRRDALGLVGAAGAALALPGCGSSVGGGSGGGSGGGGSVKVGLVIPQAGVYAPLGTDMKRAWDLWLERNGGKFADYTVSTVVGDEGETPQTGVPAVQKLLQNDQCDLLVGIVSSATALGVRDMVTEAKKVLVISNAGAVDLTGKASSPYVWRTSFTNSQVSAAMGKYLADQGFKDAVYTIAPDYAAGAEALAGFTKAFQAGGGTIADTAKPAFGKTQDYQPFLSAIRSSGAKATFCFFAGAEAVAFVKQYAQFGLAGTIPLYGSGFLTEGGVLTAQGDTALGVQTSLHYTSELDNPANKEFVEAYRGKYNEAPTVYSVQTWDAAAVLNKALGSAGGLDGDSVSKALGGVGPVEDSPRGTWSFSGQTPKQKFYLRKVDGRDGGYVNTVVADLGELTQDV